MDPLGAGNLHHGEARSPLDLAGDSHYPYVEACNLLEVAPHSLYCPFVDPHSLLEVVVGEPVVIDIHPSLKAERYSFDLGAVVECSLYLCDPDSPDDPSGGDNLAWGGHNRHADVEVEGSNGGVGVGDAGDEGAAGSASTDLPLHKDLGVEVISWVVGVVPEVFLRVTLAGGYVAAQGRERSRQSEGFPPGEEYVVAVVALEDTDNAHRELGLAAGYSSLRLVHEHRSNLPSWHGCSLGMSAMDGEGHDAPEGVPRGRQTHVNNSTAHCAHLAPCSVIVHAGKGQTEPSSRRAPR